MHLQIYASQFMTSHIPLLFVLLYRESVKRKGKNYKSLNISRTKRVFFDEIKNTFHIFGRAIICWKNKNLIKKVNTSCKDWNNFRNNFPHLPPHKCTYALVKRQVKDSLISKYWKYFWFQMKRFPCFALFYYFGS